jgi:hypothetical protein
MDDLTWEEPDEEPVGSEDDPGLIGGGGPAVEMDDLSGPDDEDQHLEDTEH